LIDLNEVQPITGATATRALPFADIADRLNNRIEELARSLLGEANRALSTRTQRRYGRKGSIAVETGGEKQGRWYDHENGVGGDALALICRELHLANGAAYTWAVEWLGIDSGDALQRPSKPQPEVACEGGDRAAKGAAIVRECRPPEGTAAERYLRNRGIMAALPAALRFRPNAHGGYGALVALATDASGSVTALQQVYVTDDGRKAPINVQKRTHKARDDWSGTSSV